MSQNQKNERSHGETCNFCSTLIKPEMYKAHPGRYTYCHSCQRQQGIPRFRVPITDENVHFHMKGVFEAFVAEVEQAPSIYGYKNFDRLYADVKFYYSYLTEQEFTSLLEYIYDFESRWSEYIDLVLNHGQFMELSSTGGIKKDIKTSEDWAAAIRNLLRILSMANTSIQGQLTLLTSPESQLKKKDACQKQPVSKCRHPCIVTKSKMGFKSCTFKTS